MEYKIDITSAFENDLDAILDYISYKLFAPAAAERFLGNIQSTVSNIHENPLRFPLYHDERISSKGYHYAVVGNYILFYRIDDSKNVIYVSRLIYGKQNITAII